MSTNVIAFINRKLEEGMGDPSITSKEYLLIKKTYLTVVDFINKYENTLTSPSNQETYKVDYSCPDRNSFIEAVENNL